MRDAGPASVPADERERRLAEGLARGDRAAVREFLDATHRPVYLMTARLTRDPDLRHDWTHDILLRIVEELGRGRFVYRWPGCFWSWFRQRSHFLLITLHHRHRRQEDRWTAGEVGEEIVARLALPGGTDPSRLIEGMEARAAIEACLDALDSEDHREALHLLLFQELSYQEIADRRRSALNTVRSWIRRARVAMRECLAGKYGLESDEPA